MVSRVRRYLVLWKGHQMLKGMAHVHFAEGERGPEEATLKFADAIAFLESQHIEKLVATFHLRHPVDLRLATPSLLIRLINEYSGSIRIALMPEANIVLVRDRASARKVISHDIHSYRQLDTGLDAPHMPDGWILSAHFTRKLGWTYLDDEGYAIEQTYDYMSDAYVQVMNQDWRGWVGHPYQWCKKGNSDEAMRKLLAAAVATSHAIEIPVGDRFRDAHTTRAVARRNMPLFRPELIARFASYSIDTGAPLIAISLDAHHLDDLRYGVENASKVAEWLIAEGVKPAQIWGWQD